MKNNIVRVFQNTNMSRQHDGLMEMAKKNNITIEALPPGEHVVFLNRACTKVKVYSPNGVLSYYRAPEGQKLNLKMIAYIPRSFDKGGILRWSEVEMALFNDLIKKLV